MKKLIILFILSGLMFGQSKETKTPTLTDAQKVSFIQKREAAKDLLLQRVALENQYRDIQAKLDKATKDLQDAADQLFKELNISKSDYILNYDLTFSPVKPDEKK